MTINKKQNLFVSKIFLTTSFEKIFSYFSIFTIVLGTTLGSLNSAYAADLTLGADDVWADAVGADGTGATPPTVADPADGDNVDLDGYDLTINNAVATIGAITDSDSGGSTNDVIITNVDGGGAMSVVIGSILTADTGALTMDMIDDEAALTVTVSGNVTTGGVVTLTSLEATAAADMLLDIGGNLTNTGALTLTAAATSDATVNIAGNFTAGAATVLDDDTGLSKLVFDGSSAQTIGGAAINGAGAGEGTISVTNTGGTVTFEEAIGATDLLSISTAASTTTVFEAAVDTVGLTQAGTATFSGAVGGITTATLTGDTTFSSTLAAATVDINSGTQTFSGKVTASTKIDVAGSSTIVNIDSAPDTANLTVAEGVVNISVQDVDIDDLDLNSGDIVIEKTVTNGQTVFLAASQGDTLVGTGDIYMPVNLSNGQTLVLFEDSDGSAVAALEEEDVDGVVVDTALTNYVASESGNNVVVTSNDKSMGTTASELSVTENTAKALLQARNAAITDTNADGNAADAMYNALNAKGGYSATEDTAFAK